MKDEASGCCCDMSSFVLGLAMLTLDAFEGLPSRDEYRIAGSWWR